MSNRAAANLDRHSAHHQHPVGREHHLVSAGDLTGQQFADAPRRQNLGEPPSQAVAGQPQQPARLVVDQRDAAVNVGRDGPFTDAVQARLPLFEERGDLTGLQAESLPLEPPGQKQ